MGSSDAEMYDVERIVADRVHNHKKQYLIKWLGYSHSENTWEDEENIFCEELKIEYEKNKAKSAEARATKKKITNATKKSAKNTTSAGFKRPTVTNEWDDSIKKVLGVSQSKEGTLEVEYLTKDGKKGVCDVKEIHTKAPLRLIEFYEDNLSFLE